MPVPEAAGRVFGGAFGSICRYVDILTSVGVERGLIGPREVDRIWERHIFNSVALGDLIPGGSTLADVGSGAGLPGLPLAIARTDLTVTLIDALLRRVTFLGETVTALGLDARVQVVRARAEEIRTGFDVVTARAVAPLDRLIGWCAPLLGSNGQLLALKGDSAADEVHRASPVLTRLRLSADVLTVRASPDTATTTVVRIRRR